MKAYNVHNAFKNCSFEGEARYTGLAGVEQGCVETVGLSVRVRTRNSTPTSML